MLKSKQIILKRNEFYEEFKRAMYRFKMDGINPTINAMIGKLKVIFPDLSGAVIECCVPILFKRCLYKNWIIKTDHCDEQGNKKYRITENFSQDCKKTASIVAIEKQYIKRVEDAWLEEVGRPLTQQDINDLLEDIKYRRLVDKDDKMDDKTFEAEQKEAEKLSL